MHLYMKLCVCVCVCVYTGIHYVMGTKSYPLQV